MAHSHGDPMAYLLSCDTVVAVGDATADGGVLLAKNSDRPSHEAQRLINVPRQEHPAGSTVHCQYLTISQVEHTAALIGSQPYWLWGCEHGMNEHGVAIGNEAIFTRETPQERGLLGMDLVRLGLERGSSALSALQAITALLDRFGQGGSAAHRAVRYYDNSFLIADAGEAWVLETSGRQWAARHVAQGSYAISNRPTIGQDYDLASADLIAHAEERGWWPRGRRPFDFSAAYMDPEHDGVASASCRLARSRSHLAADQGAALTVPAMMALLRDHGAQPVGSAGPLSWPSGGEVATVCMHGSGTHSATAASMVAHLKQGTLPAYWASMAPPCTGLFLPCWVDAGVPALLAQADEVPAATSPWWRYRRLWEAVAAAPDPQAAAAEVRRAWQPLEEQTLRQVTALPANVGPEIRRQLTDAVMNTAMEVLAHLEQR